jgi:PTS system nitrogen regulatory IIA component
MKNLLNALMEGRLVELPACEKDKALELLALLIEAVPDIGVKTDIVKAVKEREAQANTGIGRGVACPHCRVPMEGDLICAIGWSPEGIDYGAPDGKAVHLLVMYYIPDHHRNVFLKEISGLAKAVEAGKDLETLASLKDIHTVREKLLDWVGIAIKEAMPEAKARMIKLEAKQASITAVPPPQAAVQGIGAAILPFRLVRWPEGAVVLCRDAALSEILEKSAELGALMGASAQFDEAGYRIAVLSEASFSRGRKEYEAVAVKLE